MAAPLMVKNKQLQLNNTITTSKQAVYTAIRYHIDLFKFKWCVLGINGFLLSADVTDTCRSHSDSTS